MQDLWALYNASPRAFFTALDARFKDLDDRIENIRTQVAGISDLADAFIRRLPQHLAPAAAPTQWTYRAELPNLYFDDVFEPEMKALPLRWVGKTGRLTWTLRLPRIAQYDFSVQCVDFSSEDMRSSLCLKVGGTRYPWVNTENNLFETIILENDEEGDMVLELGVNPGTVVTQNDVTFSFSRIDVCRRG